jgi:hypothetical protein
VSPCSPPRQVGVAQSIVVNAFSAISTVKTHAYPGGDDPFVGRRHGEGRGPAAHHAIYSTSAQLRAPTSASSCAPRGGAVAQPPTSCRHLSSQRWSCVRTVVIRCRFARVC